MKIYIDLKLGTYINQCKLYPWGVLILQIPDNEKTNEATTNEKWDFDPSTPHSSLKRPMSSPLKSNVL